VPEWNIITQGANLINIWSLGMRTWSNRRTPLSILLYAPLPNFPPISPRVTPGSGEWSSKLRSCTMKPGTRTCISHKEREYLKVTKKQTLYHVCRSPFLQLSTERTRLHEWKLSPSHQATTANMKETCNKLWKKIFKKILMANIILKKGKGK
jgi:hypothetical protein